MMLQTITSSKSRIRISMAASGRAARALTLGGFVLAVAVLGFVPQLRAATFTLESGRTIYGEIIHATRSAIMIKAVDGSIRQLSLSDIETVGIKLRSGQVVTGALKGWSNRTYAVAVEGRLLKIQQAKLVADEALQEDAPAAKPQRKVVTAPAAAQPRATEKKAAKPKPEVTATIAIPPISQANAAELEADRQAAQLALVDSQRLNEKLVQTMEARATEAAKLREELTLAKQIIERQKAALSKPAGQAENLNGKLSSLQNESQRLEAALRESEQARLATEQALSQAEADIMGLLDDTEAYRTRAATFRLKLEESAAALETVRQMLKKSENEKQNLQIELNEARREIEEMRSIAEAPAAQN